MSGKTPGWWENPDFIDQTQLCADPEYLDQVKDEIDEWVNSIEPEENTESVEPFTMENRFDVILKENLQGIPAGTKGVIVIKDDFKKIKIEFICPDGKIISVNEDPDRLIEIVEILEA